MAGRLLAGAAALLTLLGAALVTAAGVRTGRLWAAGHLSEAGESGQPGAGWYRLGMVVLAAGVLALAGAIRPIVALAAWLLAACAGFASRRILAAVAAVFVVWQVSIARDAFGHGDAGRDPFHHVSRRLLWSPC